MAFAKEFGLNRQEAEDVVHDVFVGLWEKMDSINTETARAYLFQAIRNRCLNYIQRLKNRTVLQDVMLERRELPDPIDEELYIYSELKNHLDTAIDKLPQQQRKIFIMARRENKTAAEIAIEMELSPRTVEKHLELASAKIRQSFLKYLSIIISALIN